MSDSNPSLMESIMKKASETVANIFANTDTISSNLTNGTNETEKFKATPEGLFLAYSSLVVMALIPIIVGSFKSVKHQSNQKESGEEIETMSTREAALFPVIASVTLFGIYLVFQIFSKEHINLLLAFYFFLLGVIALTRMFSSTLGMFWPTSLIENETYDLHFTLNSKNSKNESKEILFVKQIFDRQLIVCFLISLAIGVWYFLKKHWIANNIFGLAFAVNGIEFLQLNKVLNGFILLGGLFFYDVFWVFGTNVMVSVAKSFDAPIKLIFPQDLIERGFSAEKYALLGLGDIVIPGIFIALLLRYDMSLNRKRRTYFYSSFIAYILALFCTIFVMHVFKHAQPALLYIVPLCLITPLTVALIQGDLKSMFLYRDHDDESNQSSANASLNSTNSSEASQSITSQDSPKQESKKVK
ncbi:minor histocompatibility antigen H13 [Brachionus plicatilis]|uniref:Minor histocompatibility antigen H13 n=1 Tax=Brachionus plicatilis TaxID=10195 RepID=A0A3M7RZY7_BRAPC|nr:minor histocompatibility antigen H13 [Brachionus plicatilis]